MVACASKQPAIRYDDPVEAVRPARAAEAGPGRRAAEAVAAAGPAEAAARSPAGGTGAGRSEGPGELGPTPRQECSRSRRHGYVNAVQVYPYSAGALYQAHTAPGR